MAGRVTIGFYNSYDPVRFHEVHRRSLARAGPLALAFDCDLAIFGFPFEKALSTPAEIAPWLSSATSIGECGAYLIDLAKKGRFACFDFLRKSFPPQLGIVVTTQNPSPKKSVSGEQVRELVRWGRSILQVFGHGPHGLPDDVFEIAERHLDITGRGYSLETWTALGAVIGSLLGK